MIRDKLVNELKRYSELFVSEHVELIDFDSLVLCLQECCDMFVEYSDLSIQYKVLQDDLVLRISGMEKAIAVISQEKENSEELSSFIESLHSISATNLLQQYKKTQARFRDSFPTSFGVLKTPLTCKDYSDYR